MNLSESLLVHELRPTPTNRTQFAWSNFKNMPEESGCYVLTNFVGAVLYVGQATSSMRDRFCAHLETNEKRALSHLGVPYWCYYLLYEQNKVGSVEQGWLNQSLLKTGNRPVLNKIDAPT